MVLRGGLFRMLPLVLVPLAGVMALEDAVVVEERGRSVEYEVACDELQCTPHSGELPHALKIDDQGTPAATLHRSEELAETSGNRLDLVLYPKGEARSDANRRIVTRRILVKCAGAADAQTIADAAGARRFEKPPYAPDFVILHFDGAADALEKLGALRDRADCVSANPILARQQFKRLIPNDPRYRWTSSNTAYQWHLNNTGQNGGSSGIDINVESAWNSRTGNGVRIGIVDDGLEITHPDLAPNVDTTTDYDWNDGTPTDPSPTPADYHGTACAGVAAARGNNGIGISGAAPRAELVGLRLVAAPSSDAEEAAAMNWHSASGNIIDIKSNSWGPLDGGTSLDGPGPLTEAALASTAANGRGGKGTIHLWAAGNGGDNDNVNYDGYANSIYTIAVGALNDKGERSSYSEPGASKVISAPSDDGFGDQGITTTDLLYYDSYIDLFGGTSSASPLVAGVCALMLEENPNLGWRDVQEILIRSATKVNPGHSSWSNNAVGIPFSHDYGAGMVNATAAVNMAKTWTNLRPQVSASILQSPSTNIPDMGTTSRFFYFDGSSPQRVEHVTVTVQMTHANRGQIRILLASPGGTVSQLAVPHDDSGDNYPNWTMMSVHHWGESSQGTWTLTVQDTQPGTAGTLHNTAVKLWGSNIPPTITSPLTAGTLVDTPFEYQITATGNPVSFGATGLPAGLRIDTATGLISGTPTVAGHDNVLLSATNGGGTGTQNLALEIGLPGPINDALDEDGHWWTHRGNEDWFPHTVTTYSGGDAMRSGDIWHNESSILSTQITGPGVASFYWKVSSQMNYDFLGIRLNGVDLHRISGERDWEQRWISIPEGTHALSWSYAKNGSVAAGSDAGYVDRFTFSPGSTSLPVPTLGDAVDFPGLVWTSDGQADWEPQSGVTHDGVDAAGSGVIGDSSTTTLETTVVGPGTLSFWWKTSTQQNFDNFRFYIDNYNEATITGETDWTYHTVNVTAGVRTLNWRYIKGSFGVAGSDAAWVDQVVWIPDGATAWEVWSDRHFTEDEQEDPKIGQAESDPDGDLRSNLLEYALDGDPFVPDSTGPTVELDGSNLLFTYEFDTSKTDITCTPMLSSDFFIWTPVSTEVIDTNGSVETRRATVPHSPDRQVMRLQVTQ